MYQIAICDDVREAAERVAVSVSQQLQRQGCPAEIDCYTDPLALEQRLKEQVCYDVLMLDIDMPGRNGIELSRTFRAHGGDALVVFISGKDSMVFQTFDVQPFRFLRKNYFDEEIAAVCHDIAAELSRRNDQWLRFSDDRGGQFYSVNVRKLIYVEACGKNCKLYTREQIHQVRIRLNELYQKLRPFSFLQTHRSFLVNPAYIYRIDFETVLLDDGTTLPVGRSKRTQLKKEFFDWAGEGAFL